jgi:import inner membrane translocase subunit TIM23
MTTKTNENNDLPAPPPLPIIGSPQTSFGVVSPMFGGGMMLGQHGGGGGRIAQPEYLDFNIGGRSWFERMVYNTGTLYLFGIVLGGSFGLVEGWRTAPSSKFNIRVNSILNKTGRRGARLGNALGSIAFLYSVVEGINENWGPQWDRLTHQEWVTPATSAFLTGLIYKSTAPSPKVKVLAGVLGAGLAMTSYGVKSIFPNLGFRKGLLFF